jgi:uncharacterized protein (DUF1778 family)
MATLTAARETTINLRAHINQRELIDQAALLSGQSRTYFMLEAACEKARTILLESTVFALDEERFKQFNALLDAPLEPNEAILRLLKQPAPWEK